MRSRYDDLPDWPHDPIRDEEWRDDRGAGVPPWLVIGVILATWLIFQWRGC